MKGSASQRQRLQRQWSPELLLQVCVSLLQVLVQNFLLSGLPIFWQVDTLFAIRRFWSKGFLRLPSSPIFVRRIILKALALVVARSMILSMSYKNMPEINHYFLESYFIDQNIGLDIGSGKIFIWNSGSLPCFSDASKVRIACPEELQQYANRIEE